MVEIATIECYLHHISPNDTLTEAYLGEKLVIIGNIVAGVSRINIINKILCETDNNALEVERRELIENNDLLFSQLPNLPLLEAASLTCGVEFFFEALCCATRQEALKQQSEIYKLGICTEKAKNAEIMVLKQDYINKQNIIFEKERKLGEYLERRLKIELSNYNKFEMLNCEKITPYFMNLVKSCKKESTLDGIVREDGNIFTNKSEQEEYICKSFEELYKKPDENILGAECIRDFLGEVSNINTVQEAKLNDMEKIYSSNRLKLKS